MVDPWKWKSDPFRSPCEIRDVVPSTFDSFYCNVLEMLGLVFQASLNLGFTYLNFFRVLERDQHFKDLGLTQNSTINNFCSNITTSTQSEICGDPSKLSFLFSPYKWQEDCLAHTDFFIVLELVLVAFVSFFKALRKRTDRYASIKSTVDGWLELISCARYSVLKFLPRMKMFRGISNLLYLKLLDKTESDKDSNQKKFRLQKCCRAIASVFIKSFFISLVFV